MYFMNFYIILISVVLGLFFVLLGANSVSASNANLASKLSGYILLQVQGRGEAWYVNPEDKKRYYMEDGEAAYGIMRYFGLGVNNVDIASLLSGDANLIERLRGRIVLQVEAHGEAYYIHPENGGVHYLRNGEVAYELMRELSLGITNFDLNKIEKGEVNFIVNEKEGKGIVEDLITIISDEIIPPVNAGVISGLSKGVELKNFNIDSNLDIVDINEYWLGSINKLRLENNLDELVVHESWINTATEWVQYMSEIDLATHTRPNGESMHKWIDQRSLNIGERGGKDGWQRNYFTENVAWNLVDGMDMSDIQEAMDETFAWMVDEVSYNGIHYRTMVHPDWNSVGVGVSVSELSGRYQVYLVIHYGNLSL